VAEALAHEELRRSDRGPQARGNPENEPPAKDSSSAQPTSAAQDDGKNKDDKGGKDDEGSKDSSKKKDGEQAKPSPRKKTWVRVVIIIVVIAMLIAGGIWFYTYWTHGRFVQSTNNAYLQADQVTVSAKVAGTVMQVFAVDNQQIRAGDPLAQLDDRTNRTKVAQALAQAAQDRATIAQYEAQIDEQRATIVQAQSAVDGAEAQRRYNQGEVDRFTPLVATGAEPADQLSQRVSNRDQAVSTLRENQAKALQARRRVATLSAQIGTARAQIAQAEAEAQQAQIDVDSALIRASVDGRVGDRQVRVGQEAQVGTRLLTLVPVQSIYLVANFKETQIGLMRVGQPATVTVDALDGDPMSGTVDSFSPATGANFALIPPNNATGNFTKIVQRVPVRIRLNVGDEARKVLVPGLSVEVSVDTSGKKEEAERRDQESKRDKPQREQQREDSVTKDRARPASGAGQ
jgi:membrane fusion protein, multidrug efflux system